MPLSAPTPRQTLMLRPEKRKLRVSSVTGASPPGRHANDQVQEGSERDEPVASAEIFGKRGKVRIRHAGRVYLLRVTQRGRLLLTAEA